MAGSEDLTKSDKKVLYPLHLSIIYSHSLSTKGIGYFDGRQRVIRGDLVRNKQPNRDNPKQERFSHANNPVYGNAWTGYNAKNGSTGSSLTPRYSNDKTRGVSTLASLHDFTSTTQSNTYQCSLEQGLVASEYFISFWYYFDKQGSAWSTNVKSWILYGNESGNYPTAYSGWGEQLTADDDHRTALQDNGGVTDTTMWDGAMCLDNLDGSWHLFQIYIKQSTTNVADGVYRLWIDGSLRFDDSTAKTRTTSYYYNRVRLGFFEEVRTNRSDAVYIDDVYIDNTLARVEIGNQPVFANCTHKEMQIPTAWADDEITITLNQGSFTDAENIYLFVVDSDGNASDGLLVSGASGTAPGEGDTTYPSIAVTSPAPNSTGNHIDVPIVFHVADDASGVSLVAASNELSINNVVVATGDIGLSGTKYDYTVTVAHDDFIPGETVDIGVHFSDLSENEVLYTWEFTIEDNTLRPGSGAISLGSGAWTLGMKAFDFIFGDEAYAESVEIDVPPSCSSLNGYWEITGGEVVDLDITDCTKEIDVNYDKRKFVVYGGREEIFGDLNIDFTEDSYPFIFDVDVTYASTKAEELTAPDYHIEKELQ